MTYGELVAEIDARRQAEREREQFLDLLNGKRCAIDAALHGIASCPADHMINKPGGERAPKTQDEVVQMGWDLPGTGGNS